MLVDYHVHLAALPTAGNGAYISPRLRASPLFKLTAFTQGLPVDEPEKANALYVEGLLRSLEASARVSHAVLLPIDGAYDASGRFDPSRTDFLIPNDLALAVKHPKILPACSVNPARRDALDELERCAAAGAVLCKVLPNAQLFDPGEARYKEFFRALARLKLPLLSHVGHEYSLKGADQSAGDPVRLRLALEEGATVIAAHGCSSGLFFTEPHLSTMLELTEKYPRFYTDLSALTLPNRIGMLFRLKRYPQLRVLFGTDYPLIVFWPGGNYFDRQASALSAFGLKVPDGLGPIDPGRVPAPVLS